MNFEKKFPIVVLSVILFSGGIDILIFESYAESKSIEPIITLEPYNSERIEIHVKFMDVIGQTINHINYDITARYNSVTVLDDIKVHVHDGVNVHLTAPLDIKPNSNDSLDIEIVFRGIGLSEPYGGPIGKVFQITESLNLQDNTSNADITAPLLIVPQNITVTAKDSNGAIVEYTVKAIDDVDGVISTKCLPESGSLFLVGTNIVQCHTSDSANNVEQKSFMITVQYTPDESIPDWIKDVAGFWCSDDIDDAGFVEAIRYLIANNVITIPPTESTQSSQQIPRWIKNNACWWSAGQISDDDFTKGLQHLISIGILQFS